MTGNRLIDLTGQRFGRLAVLNRAADRFTPTGYRMPYWSVTCECGTQFETAGQRLRKGEARSCGCLGRARAGQPMKPIVRYRGAHTRLTRSLGAAGAHSCVKCGGPANEWAYMHNDPDELTDPRLGLTYSLKPSHYSAMCRSCHSRFDRESRAAS